MTQLEFLDMARRRVAQVAVGPSTLRGNGPKGTAVAVRKHLASRDLGGFVQRTEVAFRKRLDFETDELLAAMPRSARHWGLARKLLNIFLRDALYNRYVSSAEHFEGIEEWLEVPLDSHVGKRLRREPGFNALPPWGTIRGLTPVVHRQFQDAASSVARLHGVARVHLDLLYWRGDA